MGIVFGKVGVAEPVYDILLSRSTTSIPYQIRRYGTRYAIETEYKADRQGDGFRALAGYIGVMGTPQNEGAVSVAMTAPVITESVAKGEKIAMTAPVVTSDDAESEMKKMQFILPKEYDDMVKIPKPTNPKVAVKEVPPATGAVYTFSGAMNDTKSKSKAKAFVQQLNEDGVNLNEKEALESYDLWQFNPPFTLAPLRRNEIWINLTEEQVDELLEKYKKKNTE
mmetsp:Transcript_2028/g.2758  ORF Transcript_2028/g.2758 Transcript_2028/m.2758 type:complete len:224 (+) Transcript_2028:115-786(+)